MFMVRVFILTLPYNVCIAQSTGAIARLFPSPWGEGRVRGLSLRGAQRRGNLLCTPSSGRLIYVGMQLASMTATRAGKAASNACPEPEPRTTRSARVRGRLREWLGDYARASL